MNSFRDMFGNAIHENWQKLKSESQLAAIIEESNKKPVAIFKHSTSCGISHMVKDQIEGNYDVDNKNLSFYYLDLLSYRPISNKVAEVLKVPHQSPQLILLKNGEVVHNASHHMISLDAIKKHLT